MGLITRDRRRQGVTLIHDWHVDSLAGHAVGLAGSCSGTQAAPVRPAAASGIARQRCQSSSPRARATQAALPVGQPMLIN
jgi:hypothetical protein